MVYLAKSPGVVFDRGGASTVFRESNRVNKNGGFLVEVVLVRSRHLIFASRQQIPQETRP